MPRSVSPELYEQLEAQQSGTVPIILIEMTHPDLGDPYLLSTDPTTRVSDDPYQLGTVHNGQIYYFIVMSIRLPDDADSVIPQAEIVLNAFDQNIIDIIKDLKTFPKLTFKLVSTLDVNFVEQQWDDFLTTSVRGSDAGEVVFTVTREHRFATPYPCDRMTYSRFPGLKR